MRADQAYGCIRKQATVRIGLDFDGTYTRDPLLWDRFIAVANEHGHEVICVTMRFEDESLADFPCEVIYTARKGKVGHMVKLGRPIDIWIDDNPQWLLLDAAA